ncbi:MAG: hypothetical protein BTN85_0688 [Candidatus Methanohalarchaeum thermophilum]|uniref:Uncharacterized protein n=1 Tax=Methanohalarchaeum thermophilum TaxID=1903181 RepID=A0A1Q6DV67_METT1|nr:MAG: hypothetical protein BTN85_0688 [Candidatus Methanohalarchaeum thermophilum]
MVGVGATGRRISGPILRVKLIYDTFLCPDSILLPGQRVPGVDLGAVKEA